MILQPLLASAPAFAYDYSADENIPRPREPALGAFGEKLRKQRERQGIGLDAVSDTTKISIRMLRALEEEHFDQLPGGVFNKGFVRAYARQVGLNEEEAVADYLDAMRQTQLQAHSLSPDFRNLPGDDPHSDDLNGHDLPDRDVPSSPAGKHTRNNRSQPPRANDRRKQSRRSEDRRPADSHSEARHKKEEHRPKDLPPPPDSSTASPAAQLPWGKLAVALLLVTFTLALWNSRRHREPAGAPQATAFSPQSPARVTAPAPSAPARNPTVAKASPAKTLSSGKLSPGTIPTASTRFRLQRAQPARVVCIVAGLESGPHGASPARFHQFRSHAFSERAPHQSPTRRGLQVTRRDETAQHI